MAAQQNKIIIDSLWKQFNTRKGKVTALQNINLTIPEGSFLVIVGPSGCGKTTLLRILADLEHETAGSVTINRTSKDKPLNNMIFQENSVLPWMTVRNNIGYGLMIRRVDKAKRDEIVNRYIKMVGLSKFADAYPHQLSGGMKQRVSIARAFANDPEILLMDEPFASLDEQNRILLQQELVKIWESHRKTVIYITHSIDEALNLGDQVAIMTAHPGRIKAIIDVDLPRPRNITEIRKDPRFAEQFHLIWNQLREEVMRAKAEEGLVLEGAEGA